MKKILALLCISFALGCSSSSEAIKHEVPAERPSMPSAAGGASGSSSAANDRMESSVAPSD